MFNELTMNDMRFSFGAGLRFAIQQFPFRFLFAKRFVVQDWKTQWMEGAIPWFGGLDFVISFALSTY